jgi:hypothetical protein
VELTYPSDKKGPDLKESYRKGAQMVILHYSNATNASYAHIPGTWLLPETLNKRRRHPALLRAPIL